MLSKRLTFSLVFVLMLALVAVPAMAQTLTAAPPKDGFAVVAVSATPPGVTLPTDAAINGILATDLADLLTFGGTIELQMAFAAVDAPTADNLAKAAADRNAAALLPGASDADKKAGHWNDFIITEIMWGLDGITDATKASSQWIEIYNNSGAALPNASLLRVMIYPNERSTNTAVTPIKTVAASTAADTDTDGLEDTAVWVLVDRVGTLDRFGRLWAPKGQSGNALAAGITAENPAKNLISMYRKQDLTPAGTAYKGEKVGDGKFWNDGTAAGSWDASASRFNTSGFYLGTPFVSHRAAPGGRTFALAAVGATTDGSGIIINEVRDDPSRSNVDWIELYNNSAAGTPAISVKNWRLRLATATMNDDGTYKDHKTVVLAVLPDYRIPAGEYLLIVNRDPEDTDLADGTNLADVEARKDVKRGATHVYHISEDLKLPGSGKYLIILRSGDKGDDNYHEQFVDFAGNGFFKETTNAGTDVWPLRGWSVPGDVKQEDFGGDNTFADIGMSFARTHAGAKVKSRANRLHHEDWAAVGAQGGIGYDRKVDLATSPGTPGYANNAHLGFVDNDQGNADVTDDVMFDGKITISEVMYDPGPRDRTPQWIELHNSSMTQAINLEGWEMSIRNKEYEGKFYVDANFEFEEATVLPNQTLLLVSKAGPNDVADNRVYNLLARHQRDLNLLPGDSILLSPGGFYLELTARSMINGREEFDVMDKAGNLMPDGAQLTPLWELPPISDGGPRQSLVRAYGPMAIDGAGTPEPAADGTMEDSWIPSEESTFYYGGRGDMGTPGYRKGGPLPVSLSKFRPTRNQETGHVDITWITESELNNAGFNVLRAESKTGDFKVINVKGIIAGHGTTSEKHVYTFTDTTAKPNIVYYYQIEDVSFNGQRTTLTTTHLRGHVGAGGKLTTTWGDLKQVK